MARSLADLAAHASPEAVALARSVLEQDVADRRWGEQIGPSLTQGDTARLLGKSEQAVSKDRRLLRVRNRDGRLVYPCFQFDGRAHKPGVAQAVQLLRHTLEPLTVASWFTAPNRSLDGRSPVGAIDDGDAELVMTLARRFAARAAV